MVGGKNKKLIIQSSYGLRPQRSTGRGLRQHAGRHELRGCTESFVILLCCANQFCSDVVGYNISGVFLASASVLIGNFFLV